MSQVKLSSFILLTTCVVLSLSEPGSVSLRLPNNTVPRSYDIHLEADFDNNNFTFNGVSSVIFDVLQPTNNITIHASPLIHIDKNYTKIHVKGIIQTPISQEWNPKLEFFTIKLKQMLEKGEYQIDFKWKGVKSINYTMVLPQGFFLSKIDERSHLVATQLRPRGAHSVFPCWDEPSYKANFSIYVTHHSNYTAISNMPVLEVKKVDNGKSWTSFQTTRPMSPHMINLVVGPYENISGENATVKFWNLVTAKNRMQFLQELSPLMIRILEDYTGMNYPLPELKVIYAPNYAFGVYDHFGVIIYPDFRLYDPEIEDLRGKYYSQICLTQLIATQWFGHLVTPAWWNDAWLSRSLPMYLGIKLFDKLPKNHIEKSQGIDYTFEHISIPRIMNLVMPASRKALPVISMPKSFYNIDKLSLPSDYPKGMSILHMLEHIVSGDVMQRGLRTYLKKHKFASATTDDLWTSLQEALDEKAHVANGSSVKYDIKGIMDPWLKQTGFPLLNVTRDYETGVVTITQSDATNPESTNLWSIPITYTTTSQSDILNTTITHWLHPSDKSLKLHGIPKEDWILLNLQLHDYYDVVYDRENWNRIAAYLNTDNYNKIPGLNRVQIMAYVRDLSHEVESDVELTIAVLSYLSRETSIIPLLAAQVVFNSLSRKVVNTPDYDQFRRFSLHAMENAISRMGFCKNFGKDEVTHYLNREVLQHACHFGNEECKRIARAKLMAAINSNTPKLIDHDARKWVYCAALSTANETIWDLARKAYRENPRGNLDVSKVLGCTKNQTIIRKYFSMALNSAPNDKSHSSNGIARAFDSLRFDPGKQYNLALDLLLENGEKIRQYYEVRNNTRELRYIIEGMSKYAKTSDDQAKMIKLINEQKAVLNNADESIADVKRKVESNTKIHKAFAAVFKRKIKLQGQP